jgi:hypothetical protein
MEQITRQTLAFLDQGELPGKIAVALEARRPPDFLFGLNLLETQWAFDDQLADLSDAVGTFSNLFDPDALDQATLLNARTGQRACTGCQWASRPTTSTYGRGDEHENVRRTHADRVDGP